ncbi:hypothetical protein [Lysinibacillus sp. LZ02]|uniref:hypothetical protein n=1 Tax=Lysinibacillus sp. LZ02 TaxID=3420668 RepID=UPI003D35C34B
MGSVILHLSNGEKIEMADSLEEFKNEYLDEKGYFKFGYIEIELNDIKGEPSFLVFTDQIVAVLEEK